MLPSQSFIDANKRRYLQSRAVKLSNTKRRVDSKRNIRHKIRKQILLTSDEVQKLNLMAEKFKLSESATAGYCINFYFDSFTKSEKKSVAANTNSNALSNAEADVKTLSDLLNGLGSYISGGVK